VKTPCYSFLGIPEPTFDTFRKLNNKDWKMIEERFEKKYVDGKKNSYPSVVALC
jgi:hypothetical protein